MRATAKEETLKDLRREAKAMDSESRAAISRLQNHRREWAGIENLSSLYPLPKEGVPEEGLDVDPAEVANEIQECGMLALHELDKGTFDYAGEDQDVVQAAEMSVLARAEDYLSGEDTAEILARLRRKKFVGIPCPKGTDEVVVATWRGTLIEGEKPVFGEGQYRRERRERFRATFGGDVHQDNGWFVVGDYPSQKEAVEAVEEALQSNHFAYYYGAEIEDNLTGEVVWKDE